MRIAGRRLRGVFMLRHRQCFPRFCLFTALILLHPLADAAARAQPADLASWQKHPPEFPGATLVVAADRADLHGGTAPAQAWSLLLSPDSHEHVELSATLTLREPAR